MFGFFEKNDSQIQQDVLNELKSDPSVTATEVSVTASNGIVTLRGTVPHYYEKSTAENAAQRVGGVRAVCDEIKVDLVTAYERDDQQIAEAALNALKWSYAVPEGVQVTVEKGWVTLKGVAEWDYERNAARTAVSQLMGVCGVSNNITLKPKVEASDIKTRIEGALKRFAEDEGRNIKVKVDGNQVTLSGSVHSLSEIEDARAAAWNAPGVLSVKNDLWLAA